MQEEKPGNRAKAVTFTVLLHAILGAALILGIEFSDYRPLSGPKVDIVEAELVTAPPAPRVDPEPERRRREQEAEAERRRQEELQARERQQQEHQQQEQAEAQRKQQETLARQKAEAEARRKAAQEAKKKTEAEARKKTEAAARKKQQEEARRLQAEEEARQRALAEQQARERALQDALAQEQRERELNPLRAAYIGAISQKIAQNWLRPPSITDDLKCEVLVTQLPDGSVTGARISKSSGNAVFDESVIKAIYKAAPLPPPPSPEVFDRDLDIRFCSTGELC